MYIKSISLKNFKKFSDFEAKFTSDITVVKGPNEQGKSTLLTGFLAGLFYDPKKNNKSISSLQSWQSNALYEISIAIENKGEELILYKNFETKQLSLENKTTNKKISVFSEISDYLYTIGGLRSLALFEHTAYISHDAFAHVGEGKQEITQALEELLTSSKENISTNKVIKKVTDVMAGLQKGMHQSAKNPGLLKQIEINLEKLYNTQQEIKNDLKQSATRQSKLSDYRKKYSNVSHELAIKQKQYQKNIDYFKTTREIKALHTQFDIVNADISVLEAIEKKKGYALFRINKIKHVASIDMEALMKIREKLSLKKEESIHFAKDKDILETSKASKKIEIKKAHLFATIIFFLLGLFGFLDTRLFSLWGICVLIFIYSYVFRHGLTIHTRAVVTSHYRSLHHEIAVLEKQLENIFKTAGVNNEQALREVRKQYDAFIFELEKLESKEEGILRDRTQQKITQEKDNLAKQIAVHEAGISEEEKSTIPSSAIQRSLEIDIDALKNKEQEIRQDIDVVHSSGISRYNHEDLVYVEEEIEQKIQQQKKANDKVKLYQLLFDALALAQKKTIGVSRKHIEEYMQTYLGIVTEGRYNKITVCDDLSFEVFSTEKNEMISPQAHLSRGTIDQFYLISRIAVLDLLNKGVKSLLLLDDPFTSFDAKRKEKMKEILLDLTDKFQIILFTHSSEYDEWGDVITI